MWIPEIYIYLAIPDACSHAAASSVLLTQGRGTKVHWCTCSEKCVWILADRRYIHPHTMRRKVHFVSVRKYRMIVKIKQCH